MNSSNQCLSCNSSHHRAIDGDQKCICMPGYFNNNTAVCVSCLDSCETCTNKTGCVTCISTKTQSFWSIGYQVSYIQHADSTCSSCWSLIPRCLTCTSPTACTSCVSLSNFTLASDGTCVCNTASNYYLNQYNNDNCTLCGDLILGCTSCSNAYTCSVCDSINHFELTGASCSCIAGFFLRDSSCHPCSYTCKTCVN